MPRIACRTLTASTSSSCLGDLALAADARGVDEDVALAVALDERVDRVARRARPLVDEHARSSPRMRFMRLILPAFGARRCATRGGRLVVGLGVGVVAPAGALDDRRLELADAATVERARPGRPARRRGDRARTPRRRRAASRPCWRRRGPACRCARRSSTAARSASVEPVVASITKTMTSASAIAARHVRRDPRLHRIVVSGSKPPVSTSV